MLIIIQNQSVAKNATDELYSLSDALSAIDWMLKKGQFTERRHLLITDYLSIHFIFTPYL